MHLKPDTLTTVTSLYGSSCDAKLCAETAGYIANGRLYAHTYI
jgi:hypothetical protein